MRTHKLSDDWSLDIYEGYKGEKDPNEAIFTVRHKDGHYGTFDMPKATLRVMLDFLEGEVFVEENDACKDGICGI